MPKPITVLVADDSSVVRRLMKDVLAREKDIEVVRLACHGAEAVGFFPQCKPDVVVLDVEMPEMDGVQAAKAIRALDGFVPIIMFSSLTTKGGEATFDALAAGASDCVPKPSGKGHVSEAIEHVQRELIPRIRAWAEQRKAPKPNSIVSHSPVNRSSNAKPRPFEIVAVGVSTGGPDVLGTFLSEFPSDFPIPILVVQHMPPIFTQLLAERLDKICALHVQEATDASELNPGNVWIAPGDRHLKVVASAATKRLALSDDPPEKSCRPAVDVLFRSVAKCFRDTSVAVVMTGMGTDGLDGCRQIRKAGGTILVQDEESSVVWGMPGAVAKEGLADGILNPRELGRELVRLTRQSCLSATSQ